MENILPDNATIPLAAHYKAGIPKKHLKLPNPSDPIKQSQPTILKVCEFV